MKEKKYTQTQQVIDTRRQQGGYATLGNLYQIVDTSAWATKTPQESIRRIVLPSCQKDDTHRHYDDNQQGQNYLPVRLLQIEELTDHITPN